MRDEQKVIDMVSIPSQIDPKQIGGMSYLTELMSYSNPDHFDSYEEIVDEKWKQREKTNILNIALQNDLPTESIVKKLDDLLESKIDDHSSVADQLMAMYNAPFEKKEFKQGALTGLRELDTMTNGLQDGELIIVAARPSMGKSDVMLHFAKSAGYQGYLPIVFSLEMSAESLTQRLIGSEGRYNRAKLRNPEQLFTDAQKNTWSAVIGKLEQTKIQLFDRSGQKITEMRSKIRKMMNQYPDKKPIIFINYCKISRRTDKGNIKHLLVYQVNKGL